MKSNHYKYIIPLLFLSVLSCKEDMFVGPNSENVTGLHIPLSIDIPEMRTRAIDMTPGAGLFLKKIWVGVFNANTGARILGEEIDLNNHYAASNSTLVDLVDLNLQDNLTGTTADKFCIVGVANYDDNIVTINDANKDDDYTLINELKAATDWSTFIKIAIDTEKSSFGAQSPMLVGYLSKKDVSFKSKGYIKVDQFKGVDAVNLYGNSDTEKIGDDIFISPTVNGQKITGFNTSNYLMKLRRMRSKINVSINEEPVPGITISNLEYMVFNKPKSAFLTPRRSNDFVGKSDEREFAPNSSDVLYKGKEGYSDDQEWTKSILNSSFSFEHFENKHWAKNTDGLSDYHDREKHTGDPLKGSGVFYALAGDDGDDWNNNASYFVIKMNIRDENENRNAEVYYTIHEGFINDKNGVQADESEEVKGNEILQTKLRDFSCFRNTDYYYKIKVNGIEDITTQVTTSDSDDPSHTYDQEGSIWQINYNTNSKDIKKNHYVETISDIVLDSQHVIKDDDDKNVKNTDIGLRFVGSVYDPELAQNFDVDICYNFSRGQLEGFAGLWPAPTNASTEYFVGTTSSEGQTTAYDDFIAFYNDPNSLNSKYFKQLSDKIKIKYDTKTYTVKEYIEEVLNKDADPNIKGYEIEGWRYYEKFNEAKDRKQDHIRGLYIFDLEKAKTDGQRIQTDEDKCSYFYELIGMEQVPVFLDNETYILVKHKDSPFPATFPGTENNKSLLDFDDKKEPIPLTQYPDLAFRFVGFKENNIDNVNSRDYYDIWYNVKADEYIFDFDDEDNEKNNWPDINLNNIHPTEIPKGLLSSTHIPDEMREGIKVILKTSTDETKPYDLYDFITGYERGEIALTSNDKLGVLVNEYDLSVRVPSENRNQYNEKYKRALYLFDKKNKYLEPLLFDEENNSATFKVYGVEQYPLLQNQLTLPNLSASYNKTTKTYYNVLDPGIDEIKINGLKDGNNQLIPQDFYKFKIISSNTVSAIVDVTPDSNGDYTFQIPMKALASTETGEGTISIQAVSNDGTVIFSEEYSNSKILENVGTYKLSSPPVWTVGSSGNALYEAWNDAANARGKTYGNYLTFENGNFSQQGANDNTKAGIRLANNTSTISFKVYKPCKIALTQPSQGSGIGNLALYVDNHIKEKPTVSNTTYTYTIDETDFGSKNVLEIAIRRAQGSSTDISGISIQPAN